MGDRITFDLATMPTKSRALWLDAYGAGYHDGLEAGRRELEAEWRGRMEVSAAIARKVAEVGPYHERAARRRQPERASRQRQILAERGIA